MLVWLALSWPGQCGRWTVAGRVYASGPGGRHCQRRFCLRPISPHLGWGVEAEPRCRWPAVLGCELLPGGPGSLASVLMSMRVSVYMRVSLWEALAGGYLGVAMDARGASMQGLCGPSRARIAVRWQLQFKLSGGVCCEWTSHLIHPEIFVNSVITGCLLS